MAKNGWKLSKVAITGSTRSLLAKNGRKWGLANQIRPTTLSAAIVFRYIRFWPKEHGYSRFWPLPINKIVSTKVKYMVLLARSVFILLGRLLCSIFLFLFFADTLLLASTVFFTFGFYFLLFTLLPWEGVQGGNRGNPGIKRKGRFSFDPWIPALKAFPS